jgi:hypothetical protein
MAARISVRLTADRKLEDDRSDPEGRHVNGLPSFAGPSARGYAEVLVLAVIGRV